MSFNVILVRDVWWAVYFDGELLTWCCLRSALWVAGVEVARIGVRGVMRIYRIGASIALFSASGTEIGFAIKGEG